MFTHTCTACERRQLIFPSQISAFDTTDHGLEVSFTCWCGVVQTMVSGGLAGASRRTPVAA